MTAIYDYKIEVFIPEELVFPLRDELARIGVGVIGNYDHCIAFSLVRRCKSSAVCIRMMSR